jgi:hypothetical protein
MSPTHSATLGQRRILSHNFSRAPQAGHTTSRDARALVFELQYPKKGAL